MDSDVCSDQTAEQVNHHGRKLHLPELKQKLLDTGARVALSSQVWLHAIPTRHCDVLITLPMEETTLDLQKILQILEPKLRIERRYHAYASLYALYVYVRFEDLFEGAEVIRLRKTLKARFSGCTKDFVAADAECFEGIENRKTFFKSRERAEIVLAYLTRLRTKSDITIGMKTLVEGEPLIARLISEGIILNIQPLHNQGDLKALHAKWLTSLTSAEQPLDEICDYFGQHIGLYFAWIGHYTRALCIPAILGALHWMFFHGRSDLLDDICLVSFAVVNIIWATLYMESWKRHQATLAYRWGSLNMEKDLLDDPRPEFTGTLDTSPVSGKLEVQYPPWKRLAFRYGVSYPLSFLCILIMFCLSLVIFSMDSFCSERFSESTYFYWLTILPKILFGIVITVSDDGYRTLAVWLNAQENYRTDDEYENNLIIKVTTFQFFNSFTSLFYIAFYLQDMERLADQLGTVLIVRQIYGNIREAIIPLIVERLKLSRMTYKMTRSMSEDTLRRHIDDMKTLNESRDQTSDRSAETSPRHQAQTSKECTIVESTASEQDKHLTQAEMEAILPKYDSPLEDYLEMCIQFGYVLLFSPVFPLAALCALINNVIEWRVDAFKLGHTFQRPFGRRVENIGAWQPALEVIGVLGVIVNCALIGQSGLVQRVWVDMSPVGQVLLVVILEHIVLAIKFCLALAIPDIPDDVSVEMARVEYRRREALRKLECRVDRKARPQYALESEHQRSESAHSVHGILRRRRINDKSFETAL